jgi:hypothetical protein
MSGMIQHRVGQVIDALVDGLRTTPGFRGPDDAGLAPECTVWDGPEWNISEDHADGGHLVIGWGGGDPDSVTPSADTDWQAGPIAAATRARDETTQLVCTAVAQRHDSPKEARDEAISILTAVAAYCRADPSLGLDMSETIGGVLASTYVTGGTLSQWVDRGFNAQMTFTVTYRARV